MTVDIAAVQKLKGTLSPLADVVTRESENYEASIKRWSASAEKPAVRLHSITFHFIPFTLRTLLTEIGRCRLPHFGRRCRQGYCI